MQRITVRLDDEQFEYLQRHEGEDTSSKLRSLLADKKRLEDLKELYVSMQTDKPVEVLADDVLKKKMQILETMRFFYCDMTEHGNVSKFEDLPCMKDSSFSCTTTEPSLADPENIHYCPLTDPENRVLFQK